MGTKALSSLLACSLLFAVSAVDASEENLVLQQQQRSIRVLMRAINKLNSEGDYSSLDEAGAVFEGCFLYVENSQMANLATFQEEMGVCRKTAADNKAELSRQSTDTRNTLAKRSSLACSNLKICEGLTDGMQFFTCYGEKSSVGSRELQNLSLISNDQVGNMRMHYQQIDMDQNRCNTYARNSYVSTSQAIDKDMENCIVGNFVPPADSDSS